MMMVEFMFERLKERSYRNGKVVIYLFVVILEKQEFFFIYTIFKRDTQLADKLFYLMALCNKTIYTYTS